MRAFTALAAAMCVAGTAAAQPLPAPTEDEWARATCDAVKAYAFRFVLGAYLDTCLLKEDAAVVGPTLFEFPLLGAIYDRTDEEVTVSLARADFTRDGISYDVGLREVKLKKFTPRAGSNLTPCLTFGVTTPARPPALCSSKFKMATVFWAPKGVMFRDTRIKVVVDAAAGSFKLGQKDGRAAPVAVDTTTEEDRDFGLHTGRYSVKAPPPSVATAQPAGDYARARGKYNVFAYAVVIVDAESSPYRDGPPVGKKWDCEVSQVGEFARLAAIEAFTCGP